MSPLYLGKWALGFKPPDSALGIWEDMRGDWWARCWREDYGPLRSAELAEEHLRRICGDNLVLRARWRTVAETVARRLVWTVLATAGVVGILLAISF